MGDFLGENWVTVLIVGLLAAAFVFLRTPADELASTSEFERLVSGGKPTLVEFFSNT